jgi:hypothetical protein
MEELFFSEFADDSCSCSGLFPSVALLISVLAVLPMIYSDSAIYLSLPLLCQDK